MTHEMHAYEGHIYERHTYESMPMNKRHTSVGLKLEAALLKGLPALSLTESSIKLPRR